MAPTPGFRPREERTMASELRRTLATSEVMHLLEGTLAVERALTEFYEKAIRRSVVEDVAARLREIVRERERRTRALEAAVQQLGGDPRAEPALAGPSLEFVAAAAESDRTGFFGTFADTMDLWTAEARAYENWVVLRTIALAAGEPALLRLIEAAPEEGEHNRFLQETTKDLAFEVFLAAESEVGEREAERTVGTGRPR